MSIPYKKNYQNFHSKVNTPALMRRTEELLDLELGQTFDCYHASAKRAYEQLKELHIPNAEIITFPADGKTAYQDKITPLGWNATKGKLTILQGSGIPANFVAADYEEHPFELIKGSVGTKEGGEIVRIVTEQQMLAGENVKDALVLVSPRLGPGSDFISRFLDLGVKGFLTDFAKNAKEAPDGIQWCNAYTEKGSWHITADDRPFIAFSIKPQVGAMLRDALSRGEVIAKVESDARRFESTVDVVTALVPGKRKEEFWIMAHLYEPLGNDNSSGVACAMETARLIMEKGTPEFSLRVIFGLEYYGFAAYASTRGTDLSGQVIGGINYDAMYLHEDWYIRCLSSAPGSAFYGNYLFQKCVSELNDFSNLPRLVFLNSSGAMYGDDTFLSDSTTKVPTLWPIRDGFNYWHNSKQTIDYVQPAPFTIGTALHTTLVDSIINPDPAWIGEVLPLAKELLQKEMTRTVGSAAEHMERRFEICIQDLENFARFVPAEKIESVKAELTAFYKDLTKDLADEKISSPLREQASALVVSRLTAGFPYDLEKVPFERKYRLPGGIIYGPLSNILSDMDGKRDLGTILRMAEHELCRIFTEAEILSFLKSIRFLAKYGYLRIEGEQLLSKEEIVSVLRKAGVKEGDLLAVHSSITKLGGIEGGAATLFEALKEAVGENGTFMAPAFTSPFVNIGGPARSIMYRPYDPEDASQIWTGALPKYMLKHKDVFHTKHPSHSWCIYGPAAEKIGGAQKYNDPPVGIGSPLMNMMEMGGKIVHLGNDICSTTFLHSIEDVLDLPGVQDTLVMVKTPGLPTPVCSPRNLPGCRDFYHGTKETIKFFVEAAKRGFVVEDYALGKGVIKVMDMKKLFTVGCEIAKEDPYIFLCDDPACRSCQRMKAEYDGRMAMKKEGKA